MTRRNLLRLVSMSMMMLIIFTGAVWAVSRMTDLFPLAAEETPDIQIKTGEYVCLTPVQSAGMQTTDCVSGIATDDGAVYGLDMSSMTEMDRDSYEIGDAILVRGMVISLDRLAPNSPWHGYAVDGVLDVYKISLQTEI